MSYPTDLADAQGARIAPLFAQAPGRGRRRHSDTRAVVNALRYRLRTGCQWRLLPREYLDGRLVVYKATGWAGWRDWLGPSGRPAPRRHTYWSFEQARTFVLGAGPTEQDGLGAVGAHG